MKRKMPNTIYLFPTFFDVVGITRRESKRISGHCSYSQREIAIDPSVHEEEKKGVLLHEIIHSILYQAGITNTEEETIDVLAYGFLSIIRGNKDLIRWLEVVK